MKYIIIYGILLGGVLCGGTNAVGAVRDSGACEEKVEAYSSYDGEAGNPHTLYVKRIE